MPLIEPALFPRTSVYELLAAAAEGRVGLDRRLVHAIVARPEEAAADLMRFGREDRSADPFDLRGDVLRLLAYLNPPEAIGFYIEVIKQDPVEMPDEMVDAIHLQGEKALEPLLALAQELEEEERGEVLFLLSSLGLHDERLLALLREHLEYDAADAVICLGLYGDPAARPLLQELKGKLNPRDEGEAALLKDIDDALETLGTRTPELLDEREELLAEYPETEGPDLDELPPDERAAYLDAQDVTYRLAAAESLATVEVDQRTGERLLRAAREDNDPNVRAACLEALAGGSEVPEVARLLEEKLLDEDTTPRERAGAALALSERLGEPKLRQTVEALYEHEQVRAKVLGAMWRSVDKSFAGYFTRHLNDPDLEVRRQAVMGVGYLNLSAEIGKVEKMLGEEEMRETALFAYSLCIPSEVTRGRMKGLLRKIDKIAKGLSDEEEQLVMMALDERLALHGLAPVFTQDETPVTREQ